MLGPTKTENVSFWIAPSYPDTIGNHIAWHIMWAYTRAIFIYTNLSYAPVIMMWIILWK